MTLHLPTLGLVFLVITAALGLLLLFSWMLNRQVQALAWWGGAFLLIAAAVGLAIRGGSPIAPRDLVLGNALATLAYGVLYTGNRRFNGRPVAVSLLVAGVVVWGLASPLVLDDISMRLGLMSAIAAGYAAASAWELYRHAQRFLRTQTVLVALLIILVAFNIARGVMGFSVVHTFWVEGLARRWSAPMALVLATLIPTMAFTFISMAKEQLEYDYRRAALVDPLTGISNRRAFLLDAAALLSRTSAPATCLLFDLDNFKRLNDTHGHDAGDQVLDMFGKILANHLPGGVFGRLGGEEFAALVPLGATDGARLADTIRESFASMGKIVRGTRIDVTVSAGCATSSDSATIEELLHHADVALYRAKAEGRNAVQSFTAIGA